jgi:hypothetical protein
VSLAIFPVGASAQTVDSPQLKPYGQLFDEERARVKSANDNPSVMLAIQNAAPRPARPPADAASKVKAIKDAIDARADEAQVENLVADYFASYPNLYYGYCEIGDRLDRDWSRGVPAGSKKQWIEKCYLKAANLEMDNPSPWFSLGSFYGHDTKTLEQGKNCYAIGNCLCKLQVGKSISDADFPRPLTLQEKAEVGGLVVTSPIWIPWLIYQRATIPE